MNMYTCDLLFFIKFEQISLILLFILLNNVLKITNIFICTYIIIITIILLFIAVIL